MQVTCSQDICVGPRMPFACMPWWRACRSTILSDAVRPLLKGKHVLQMGTIGEVAGRTLLAEPA